MFHNPFSFEGRIRRLEYGLSYLTYAFLYLIASFLWQEFQSAALIFYPLIAVLIWFLLAQGAKRCHDLGNSGFLQFIPFYGLFMLFQEGQSGNNIYGGNPKEVSDLKNPTEIKNPLSQINKYSIGISLLRLSSPILINVLLAAIVMEYLNISDLELLVYVSISVVPCYFLALIMNYQGYMLEIGQKQHFKERIIYSSAFYVLVRLYTLYFRNTEIYVQAILLELVVIGLFIGVTYFPFSLYKVLFRKPSRI